MIWLPDNHMDMSNTKCYLGDGVYASFDGHGLELTTERGNNTHWIYLEPDVYQNLLTYVQSLSAASNAHPDALPNASRSSSGDTGV